MKDKHPNKQTNKQTREPLSKGDSRTGLIAFIFSYPRCNKLVLLTLISFSFSNFDRSCVPNFLLFFKGI